MRGSVAAVHLVAVLIVIADFLVPANTLNTVGPLRAGRPSTARFSVPVIFVSSFSSSDYLAAIAAAGTPRPGSVTRWSLSLRSPGDISGAVNSCSVLRLHLVAAHIG